MQKYYAEIFGTFILLFSGAGAIVTNQVSQGTVTHVGIALVFGLVVTSIIYAIGEISGAHINPAVTIAFWVSRRFPGIEVVPYIICQCIGAMAACLLLKLLFPGLSNYGMTLPAGSDMQSLILEGVLTWMLMFVVLCVSTGAKETGILAGVAIGSVIALEAMFAGPISGASMNPARSLAPALVSGNLQSLWLYIVGPIAGAVLAVPSLWLVRNNRNAPASETPDEIDT
ncbi:MAG: MIP family channel protein [Planctomycetes bacterium]|nr:MIP family channel protein [Planctomycetota bacterium]MCH9723742.1 MIP family channel protein [Planctomycetota bacterium]MCH9776054.1 MIP family channel protein [Planctomycetota bacterium]MCH9791949.1 MIP family channel protein [Planctomycetota bacterium]